MARSPEGMCDLNLSASLWPEDKEELEDHCDGVESYPNYAAVASKAPTAPAATAEEGPSCCTNYQQRITSCAAIFAIAQIIPWKRCV
jgi:hypothetical protein